MRITELIKYLEGYKAKHGDVRLMKVSNDGRSSDILPVGAYLSGELITYQREWPSKTKQHMVNF